MRTNEHYKWVERNIQKQKCRILQNRILPVGKEEKMIPDIT